MAHNMNYAHGTVEEVDEEDYDRSDRQVNIQSQQLDNDVAYGRGNSPLRSHRSSASPRRDESQLEPRFEQRHGSGSEIQVYDYSRKQEPHIDRGLGVPAPMLTKKSRVTNLMLTQLAADILSIVS